MRVTHSCVFWGLLMSYFKVCKVQHIGLIGLPVRGVGLFVGDKLHDYYFTRAPVDKFISGFELTGFEMPDIKEMLSDQKRSVFENGVEFCDHVDALTLRFGKIKEDEKYPVDENAADMLRAATKGTLDWTKFIEVLDDGEVNSGQKE